MTTIAYQVTKSGDVWPVTCNGVSTMDYGTQEAAFEAAVHAASGDIRSGHFVRIDVGESSDPEGARTGGGTPVPGDGFN